MEKIKSDIAAIQAIADGWKKLSPTGQLQIAIGALGTAAEFANHHLKLAAPAPSSTAAPAAPAAKAPAAA